MNTVWTGDLLSVQGVRAWKGTERTNGFLMRNADGRIPAITQAGTIDMSLNPVTPDVLPYGNGLIRFLDEATSVHGVNQLRSGKGAATNVVQFVGVTKYEPAWASSHPVQNWGIPSYSKFTSISIGIVGYKFSKKATASDADYLAFLQGDNTKITAIDGFPDWMAALAAATVPGSNLYLCFSIATGFPKVVVGGPTLTAAAVGAGFVGVAAALVFEPENDMIGFDLQGQYVYGV